MALEEGEERGGRIDGEGEEEGRDERGEEDFSDTAMD